MRFILIAILLFSLLEGGFEWSAYKETLFVGEPIILIEKFKNTEDKSVKMPRFSAPNPFNNFDLIFNGDTFRYWPGYYADYDWRSIQRDSIVIMSKDSVYSFAIMYWKNFGLEEKKNSPFPKEGERCNILINKTVTVPLFFTEPPKEESEFFETMKNHHELTFANEEINNNNRLKHFIEKKSHLSPYFYFLQFSRDKVLAAIKTVKEMKNQFPKHILTEWAEVYLMARLFRGDPKYNELAHAMLPELTKKYSSNILLRKVLKESPATLGSKPIPKRKTLIEKFRWEIKKTLRWLKMTYYRLAWKTEYKLRRILKWLKNKGTVRKKDSVVLQLSGLNNIKDSPLISR